MTDEEPDMEGEDNISVEMLGNEWVNRFHDLIVNSPLNREDLLKILNEPWTVEEYMDAVANIGEPSAHFIDGRLIRHAPKGGVVGWHRMELVNSLIIEFLKTGTITSNWY